MRKTSAKKEYDLSAKSGAYTGLALRIFVAAYIVYLAWKILSGMMKGASPIPVWAVWIICAVLALAAVGFALYAWRFFQKAVKAAELPPQTEPGADAADETEVR